MFKKFIAYLKKRDIDYILLNGYEDIVSEKYDSDIDILLKKGDFKSIDFLLIEICKKENWKIIQKFHHEVWAKNIFLFNPISSEILNLDIYGYLSRKYVPLFNEDEIFEKAIKFENFKILNRGHEFIYYLVKKLDKNELTKVKFDYLKEIYQSDLNLCKSFVIEYFPNTHFLIEKAFGQGKIELITREKIIEDFESSKKLKLKYSPKNIFRLAKRVLKPTGLSIAFLGSDGSGKTTIINKLKAANLPFRKFQYFHLKPLKTKHSNNPVSNPHSKSLYNPLKSYIKLIYLILQYNFGWFKNILPLKIKSTLIVFDRYYDDLKVDPKRFRYGGKFFFVKLVNKLIPQPDIFFILTAKPEIIHKRKEEVEIFELKRQIQIYDSLSKKKHYYLLDVTKTPEEILEKVINIMALEMSSRHLK